MRSVRAVLTVAVLLVGEASAWIGGVNRQKLIAHGRDLRIATPEEILDNADVFDKTGVDGATVCLFGKTATGRSYSFETIAIDEPWVFSDLKPRLAALKGFAAHVGLKESLLAFQLLPQKRLAWDDDAAWGRFVGNLHVLARIGRVSGLKGYFVDFGDRSRVRQFFSTGGRNGADFDVASAFARKRGRELLSGLFAEHPDAVLFSPWFFTLNERDAGLRDPLARVRGEGDLWPAFLNGILDAIPPQAKFVDGNEWSFRDGDAEDHGFHAKAFHAWHYALGLVEPENRDRYKSQLSVGFGFCLDMFKGDESLVARFERNLEQAAFVSTEYVWLHGESCCWVPWKRTVSSQLWKDETFAKVLSGQNGPRTWEDALPGLRDILDAVRDPDAFRTRKLSELRRTGLRELISSKDRVPVDLVVWQNPEKHQGRFGKDSDSVRACGVGSGCASVHLPVMPGALYAVSVKVHGRVSANVHWKVGGREEWKLGVSRLVAQGEADADGWRMLAATVRPPADADGMVLSAWVSQRSEAEKARFRDFSAVKLR